MFKVEVLKATKSDLDDYDLFTIKATYSRIFSHEQLLTHRNFSRNSCSSRAIPYKELRQQLLNNPVVPLSFTKNKSGMKAKEDILQQEQAEEIWFKARDKAIEQADKLYELNVHKQHINRLLQPFMFINTVITGTRKSFNHFIKLRNEDAQPETELLAKEIRKQIDNVVEYNISCWHIPFIRDIEEGLDLQKKLIRSVARCARVSYNNFSFNNDFDKDENLYNKLLFNNPPHSSPFEHQAFKGSYEDLFKFFDVVPKEIRLNSNLKNWYQYRKILNI